MNYLDLATRCALDTERPGALDLLGLQGWELVGFAAACVEAALQDLQLAMDAALEAGVVETEELQAQPVAA